MGHESKMQPDACHKAKHVVTPAVTGDGAERLPTPPARQTAGLGAFASEGARFGARSSASSEPGRRSVGAQRPLAEPPEKQTHAQRFGALHAPRVTRRTADGRAGRVDGSSSAIPELCPSRTGVNVPVRARRTLPGASRAPGQHASRTQQFLWQEFSYKLAHL